MCSLQDNIYGIEFLEFRIRDIDSGKILFEVKVDPELMKHIKIEDLDDSSRFIQYNFPKEFLSLNRIGARYIIY